MFCFIESDKTNKTSIDDSLRRTSLDDTLRRTSLDDRISTILGAPIILSTEPQQLDIRPNLSTQTSTPSDKSTESPQDIKSLIQTMVKKDSTDEQRSIITKQSSIEERRSTTSKHYTTEWLASQKPEEAPPTGNS